MAAVSLPRIKYHFAGLWLVRDFARSTIFECLHLSHISFSSKISLVEQNTHDTLKLKRLIPQLSVKIKFELRERCYELGKLIRPLRIISSRVYHLRVKRILFHSIIFKFL